MTSRFFLFCDEARRPFTMSTEANDAAIVRREQPILSFLRSS